jgi:hypothetical protein
MVINNYYYECIARLFLQEKYLHRLYPELPMRISQIKYFCNNITICVDNIHSQTKSSQCQCIDWLVKFDSYIVVTIKILTNVICGLTFLERKIKELISLMLQMNSCIPIHIKDREQTLKND